MLYDPKWQKTAPSLEGLIAWLETKDPSATYQWSNCEGTCLIGQYGASIGLSWEDINRRDEYGSCLYERLSTNNDSLAWWLPHTFGGALARARLALTSPESNSL